MGILEDLEKLKQSGQSSFAEAATTGDAEIGSAATDTPSEMNTFTGVLKNQIKLDPISVLANPDNLKSSFHGELPEDAPFSLKTAEILGKYGYPILRDITTVVGATVAGSIASPIAGVASGIATGIALSNASEEGSMMLDTYRGKQISDQEKLLRRFAATGLGVAQGIGGVITKPGMAVRELLKATAKVSALEGTALNVRDAARGEEITPEKLAANYGFSAAGTFGMGLAGNAIKKYTDKAKLNRIAKGEASLNADPNKFDEIIPANVEATLKDKKSQVMKMAEYAGIEEDKVWKMIDDPKGRQELKKLVVDFTETDSWLKKFDQMSELMKSDIDPADKINGYSKIMSADKPNLPDDIYMTEGNLDIEKLKRYMITSANESIKNGDLTEYGLLAKIKNHFALSKNTVMKNSGAVGEEIYNKTILARRLQERAMGLHNDDWVQNVSSRLKTPDQSELFMELANKPPETWNDVIGRWNSVKGLKAAEIEGVKEAMLNSNRIFRAIGENGQAAGLMKKKAFDFKIMESNAGKVAKYNKLTDTTEMVDDIRYIITKKKGRDQVEGTAFYNTKKEADEAIKGLVQGEQRKLIDNYFPQVVNQAKFKQLGYAPFMEAIYKANGIEEGGKRFIIMADGSKLPMPSLAELNSAQVKKAYENLYHAYDFSRRGTQPAKFGNFHYDRNYLIPKEYLANAADTFAYYNTKANEKIAFSMVWGENNQKLFGDDLVRFAREVGVKYENKTAQDLIDTALGYAQKVTGIAKVDRVQNELINGIKNVNIIRTMLMSSVGNATQFFSPLIYGGDVKPMFKYFKSIFTDKTNTDAMLRKAGVNYNIISKDMLNALTDQVTLWGITDKFLHLNGFQLVEQANRKHAAMYGLFYLDDLVSKLNKGKYSISEDGAILRNGKLVDIKSDTTLRYMDKMDVDVKSVLGKKVDGKFKPNVDEKGMYFTTENQKLSAMRKLEIDTNFRGYIENFPEFRDSPMGSLITQLKTFSYMQTGNIYRNVIGELRHGNVKPLVYHMLTMGVSGAVAVEVATMIGCGITVASYKATGRDDLNLIGYYKSSSYFQRFMSMKRPEDFVMGYIRAMSKSGGFGMFDTGLALAQYGDPSLGPTMGTANRVAGGIKTIKDYGYDTERAFYQGYPALISALVPVPLTYMSRAAQLAYERDSAKISGNYRSKFVKKYGSAEGRIEIEEKAIELRKKNEERRKKRLNSIRP